MNKKIVSAATLCLFALLALLALFSSCAPDPGYGAGDEEHSKKPYESETYTAATPAPITEEEAGEYESLKNNSQSAFASTPETEVASFEYKKENGKVTITGYKGKQIIVRVPEYIDGTQVTCVAERAFEGSNIKALCLPDTVTSVGKGALYGCENLTTLKMPLPQDLGDNSLGIIFGSANEEYNGATVPKDLSLIVISGDAESIPDKTFYGFRYLRGISLPDSCAEFGDFAFFGCSSLIYVNTPASLNTVGRYAFGECTSMFCADVGESVESIGLGAFYRCNGLKEIKLPFAGGSAGENRYFGYIFGAETADWNEKFVPRSLGTAEFYDTCTGIADKAFYRCTSLVDVKLPKGLENIGIRAFYGCISIEEILIPDTVKKIDDDAFFGCINLEKVTVSENTEIGMQAFYGCKYAPTAEESK